MKYIYLSRPVDHPGDVRAFWAGNVNIYASGRLEPDWSPAVESLLFDIWALPVSKWGGGLSVKSPSEAARILKEEHRISLEL
jgi:hypothetical protein